LPGDDLCFRVEKLTTYNITRTQIVPSSTPHRTLDFVGTIGQLNGPKSQLTNNIWLRCDFLSFWTEKLLGLAGPNLLVIATSEASRPRAISTRCIKSVLGVIQIGFEPS
jgi:hypothetical protein